MSASAQPKPDEPGRTAMPLSRLDIGRVAVIARILPACQGAERHRLMDLGILPGTRIAAEFASPLGDPTAYRIRGALIGLRQEQASTIQVIPLDEEAQ